MKNFFLRFMILFFLSAVSLFGSCASRREMSRIYWLSGEVSAGGSQCCYDFIYENLSDKEILRTQFVLSLFDEDGEPVLDGDWIKIDYERSVLPGETVADSIMLDDWFDYDGEKIYVTDFFYAGCIEYADGTVFEDPFGRFGYS